ncbi:DUF1641 domain-containing protein [Sulfurisphaera ohwakuensis]|uniref:DUF1641 domain-containing protein n=1 Tax=Sulfurisphaera ohwakuensis TaxID=69656 RepID=A0A650CES2_SULOH|nr:DUF1641 domain-containing protein [Sulfurisphaera ohwakuensis]MBB5252787.1 uncharacterized protein YjgD (DUF1641 family) [Sulfurisphaera ohwakuensis]QGR16272.1 DUF1641 domain-containing protein [Sulfurisphaera ohwakuensis]
MQELNLEKLVEKLDNKKIEELTEILDQLPTLNETLKTVSQLKESGALDALVNLSYSAKVVRDMLTDDAIENVADMLGGLMELSEIISENGNKFAEFVKHLDLMDELLHTLHQLKETGALNAAIDALYGLKTLRDMLNDEAISNLSDSLSGILEFSSVFLQNYDKISETIRHIGVVNDLILKVKELNDSGALNALTDSAYMLKTLRDMLNDEAISNLATSISGLLELSSAVYENYDHVMKVIKNIDVASEILDKMKELKSSGALDAVFDATYFLKTLKDMLNDEAVANITTTLSLTLDFLPRGIEFLNHAMNPVFYNMVSSLTSPEAQKLLSNPPKITLGGLVAAFRDEDIQRGFGIFLTILKILGKNYKINLS